MRSSEKRVSKKSPLGGNFDDFLKDEGLYEEVNEIAMKRVVAFKLSEAMRQQNVSKSTLAERMGTKRPVVDKLLDAQAGVTLRTVCRAATALGLEAKFDLVKIKVGVKKPKPVATARAATDDRAEASERRRFAAAR